MYHALAPLRPRTAILGGALLLALSAACRADGPEDGDAKPSTSSEPPAPAIDPLPILRAAAVPCVEALDGLPVETWRLVVPDGMGERLGRACEPLVTTSRAHREALLGRPGDVRRAFGALTKVDDDLRLVRWVLAEQGAGDRAANLGLHLARSVDEVRSTLAALPEALPPREPPAVPTEAAAVAEAADRWEQGQARRLTVLAGGLIRYGLEQLSQPELVRRAQLEGMADDARVMVGQERAWWEAVAVEGVAERAAARRGALDAEEAALDAMDTALERVTSDAPPPPPARSSLVQGALEAIRGAHAQLHGTTPPAAAPTPTAGSGGDAPAARPERVPLDELPPGVRARIGLGPASGAAEAPDEGSASEADDAP